MRTRKRQTSFAYSRTALSQHGSKCQMSSLLLVSLDALVAVQRENGELGTGPPLE